MSDIRGFLSVLLALMLAATNMVFSGHVSSHTFADSELCSLCSHPGGPETAIPPETGILFVISSAFNLVQRSAPAPFLPLSLHDHLSRAPPSAT